MRANVSSHQPEAAYTVGMFASTFALAVLSISAATLASWSDCPPWGLAAMLYCALLLQGFAFAARFYIADLERTLTPYEFVTCLLVGVAVFFAPSFAARQFLLIPGLLLLQFLALVSLASEKSFARYYILCGITLAVCCAGFPPPAAMAGMACFCIILTLALSYESFFFRVEGMPAVTATSGWLPPIAAFPGTFAAIVLTVPIARLSPAIRWSLPTARSLSHRTNPGEINMDLVQVFVSTMALMLLLIALGGLLRWIRNRRRRNQETLPPESIGIPFGQARPTKDYAETVAKPDSNDPRIFLSQWYERFTMGYRAVGAERSPEQTPLEFQTTLFRLGTFRRDEITTITAEYVVARYSGAAVSWPQAKAFRNRVKKALASITTDPTDQENLNL